MTVRFTDRATHDYAALPQDVRRAFKKQLQFLLFNRQHPSLRAKKYDETHGVWQARVNRSWRFYFLVRNGVYVVLSIVLHPK